MSAEPSHPYFVYTVSLLSAIGGFLFGYDTGIVSGAMVLIKKQFVLNDVWQELIVSITIGTAWIFSAIAGYFTDRFGRKPVILVASAIFTAGSFVMACAMDKWVLLIGRGIVGCGIGLASMVVPMYIAEVAPGEIRGSLVILNTCSITAGQFVAAVVAGFLSYFEHDLAWRLMLGLAALPAFIQFVGFFFMPESPRWLIKHGKDERAREILTRTRSTAQVVQEEYQSIKENCDYEARRSEEDTANVLSKVLASKSLRKALFVGCALQSIQQLSGINTVMYYSATIIQMSGIYDVTLAIWLAAAVASVNFLCSFIGLYLVERTGRRKLTLGSLGGVIISLAVLAAGFQLAEYESPLIPSAMNTTYTNSSLPFDKCLMQTSCRKCIALDECGFCFIDSPPSYTNSTCLDTAMLSSSEFDITKSASGKCSNGTIVDEKLVWAYDWCPSEYSWMTVLGLGLYLFFFAPGMGSMPWTINAEIYPLWARGVCYSISTSFGWACNLLASLTFLSLTRAITRYGTFWLYCAFALMGWIFFASELPETRGVSLENVESLFEKKKKPSGKSALSATGTSQSYSTNNNNKISIIPRH